MDDAKASKAQNLARIRDNQRRSRARRKEYLNELETKLRNWEQMGIEASAEIQGAARRVLDENRKLRALLQKRGVPDSEIVIALGGTSDRPYEQISAVPSLNAMLERRVIRTTSSCTNSPSSTHSSLTTINGNVPSMPPLSGPLPRSATISSNDSPSPHSIVSGMDTPPGYHGSPFYNSPMTPTAEIKSEDVPSYMPYDQSFNTPWPYPSETQYVVDPTNPYAASSCVDAANIIRTMRSDAGPGYETRMMCSLPGQNTYMTNAAVYSDMNRYASQQQG